MGGGALTELSKKASPGLREFCENLPRVAWVPLSKAASKPLCLSLLIPRYVLQLCMKMTGNIGKVDFVAPITECSIVQGGPSASGKIYVDFKFKVPSPA